LGKRGTTDFMESGCGRYAVPFLCGASWLDGRFVWLPWWGDLGSRGWAVDFVASGG